MTPRGRAVLALGVLCLSAAVVFGSPALYPVAAGLVLAVPLALAWVRITPRQPRVVPRLPEKRDDVAADALLDVHAARGLDEPQHVGRVRDRGE